ncbi:hypothetical protein LJPFL01_2263 [Lelliottia jeotgali]|nr:hypothetical protein LJPFL01_2263 [Lelliottia jeotgali]
MFTRLSIAALALLTCLWMVLIFDFGNVMHHLSEILQALEAD